MEKRWTRTRENIDTIFEKYGYKPEETHTQIMEKTDVSQESTDLVEIQTLGKYRTKKINKYK